MEGKDEHQSEESESEYQFSVQEDQPRMTQNIYNYQQQSNTVGSGAGVATFGQAPPPGVTGLVQQQANFNNIGSGLFSTLLFWVTQLVVLTFICLHFFGFAH